MPQRSQELGRIVPYKIFQTITATGDTVEGSIDIPTVETNVLEILCQNWRTINISGRNVDAIQTSDWKFYATQKFNESVPPTGDTFWDVTEDHWELLSANQDTVATETNITEINIADKGYCYVVVTVEGGGVDTEIIARAVLTA